MKLAGATYMEVHAAGGGIHFTVEKTRMASEMELVDLLVDRLRRMLRTKWQRSSTWENSGWRRRATCSRRCSQ